MYKIQHNYSSLPKANKQQKRPLAILSEALTDAANNNKQKRKIAPLPVTAED